MDIDDPSIDRGYSTIICKGFLLLGNDVKEVDNLYGPDGDGFSSYGYFQCNGYSMDYGILVRNLDNMTDIKESTFRSICPNREYIKLFPDTVDIEKFITNIQTNINNEVNSNVNYDPSYLITDEMVVKLREILSRSEYGAYCMLIS